MKPVAVVAAAQEARKLSAGLPEDIRRALAGRTRQPLGDVFGLRSFGVNLGRLAPGARSSLRHAHSAQDEFVYVLEGTPTLVTDAGETLLAPGMCAGFAAGSGDAHHLINRGSIDAVYLEVGDRNEPDTCTYPDDDLQGAHDADGTFRYRRKDGTPL